MISTSLYKLNFVLELVQPLFLYISFLTHFSSFFIFFIFQPIIFKFHSNFNFVYSLSSFLYIILIALILHPILHSTSHSPLFITNYSQIIDFDFNPLLISFSSPHPILIDLYSSTIYFILHFHPLHYDITQFSPLFILFFQFHLLISFLQDLLQLNILLFFSYFYHQHLISKFTLIPFFFILFHFHIIFIITSPNLSILLFPIYSLYDILFLIHRDLYDIIQFYSHLSFNTQ